MFISLSITREGGRIDPWCIQHFLFRRTCHACWQSLSISFYNFSVISFFSPLSSVSTLALSFHRRVSFDFSASTDWTNAVGVHVHRIGCGATAAARRVRRKARIFSSVTHLGRWAWLTGRQREISDRFVHKRAKPRSQAQLWPRGVVADLVRLVLSVQFENHGERRSGCLLSD